MSADVSDARRGGGPLGAEQIARYREEGYLCPMDAVGEAGASDLLARLEAFEASAGATLGKLGGQYRAKTHLLFPWLNALCRHPAVLAPVRQILGPDLLLYHVTCWLKEPGDASFVPWHQDGTYFHLDPPLHLTAWVALTPSTEASGCVRVLPGTHRRGQLAHGEAPSRDNLLSNGQHVLDELDTRGAVSLELAPGQMSLHDTHLVHSSGPNLGTGRRIGIGISYVPTRVRYRGKHRVTASLVCGRDDHGHFDPEPVPEVDLDPLTAPFHTEACWRFFDGHGYRRG